MAEVTGVRHPVRGQLHLLDTVNYWPKGHDLNPNGTTRCGLTAKTMTEEVEVDKVDPFDRCKRCFRPADQSPAAPKV